MAQPTIQQTFNLALQHHQAGQLHDAEQLYRQILAREPNHADAMHHLGMAAGQAGRNDIAVELIGRAIAIKPDYPEALNNFGNALKGSGQLDEAIAAYRQAIALRPSHPDAHGNLGSALNAKGQHDEAIAAYGRAIALSSSNPVTYYNLGNALKDKGQLDEAMAAYRRAIALKPNYAEAHFNIGTAQGNKGKIEQAIAAYRRATALKPDYAEAHWNLALALLARGEFAEGWKEFEWRWECKDLPRRRTFAQPQWDGSSLQGRTILLHSEQGLGDTIQFIRYAPLVAEHGGTVIVGTVPELHRLLQGAAGVARWLNQGETVPTFDVHCPLMSLPAIFGTTLETIPPRVPYLQADAEQVVRWKKELAADSHRFKVGLAWAGNPTHVNDRNRSISLAALAPLATVQGVSFYSLQKGDAGKQAKASPGLHLIDRTDDLKDFADTAALVANLDLVICVDTAVAHLAGALGKPVWTLLPFTTDWRWLLKREDCPWYPSMRLFRQPGRGDWGSVIKRVGEALVVSVKKPL
jgi:Flp pilus assembly protein TadD